MQLKIEKAKFKEFSLGLFGDERSCDNSCSEEETSEFI